MVPRQQLGLGIVIGGLLGIVGTTIFFSLTRSDWELSSAVAGDEVRASKKLASWESEGAASPDANAAREAPDVEVTDPRLSFRQLDRVAEAMALQDPIAAIRAGMEIPGTDNREAFVSSVFQTWGETDGASAGAWARENLSGEDMSDALYYISEGWAESDPSGAAEWYRENTDGVILDDALWEILESWGRKDPQAAYAWSDTLDPYVKQTVMEGLAEGWASVDSVGARDAGMNMLAARENYAEDFLTSVATQWSGADPRAAAEWGANVADERIREGVLGEVAEVWSQTDPKSAAAWADGLSDPGSRRFAQTGVAAGWAEHDPSGAVDWALNMESDQRGEIVKEIVDTWAQIDPRDTIQWLDAQSAGPQKDLVLESFSETIFRDNPEVAVAWAQQIKDPARRGPQVEKLTRLWIQTEGSSAIETLNRTNAPPAIETPTFELNQ